MGLKYCLLALCATLLSVQVRFLLSIPVFGVKIGLLLFLRLGMSPTEKKSMPILVATNPFEMRNWLSSKALDHCVFLLQPINGYECLIKKEDVFIFDNMKLNLNFALGKLDYCSVEF